MRRTLKIVVITILWVVCLLFIWAMAPEGRTNIRELGMRPSAPAGRTVKFIYKGNDQQKNVAVLIPVIAPAFGVVLDSGPTTLERNTILDCIPEPRTTVITVDGQQGSMTELLLVCGAQTLVVKEVYFNP